MKKMFMLIMVVLVMFTFAGCRKVVETEQFNAEVLIMDTNYTGPITYPVKVGKVTTFRTHPADYDTIVEYQGVEYNLDGREDYEIAKKHQNEKMSAIIEKVTYDNGTTEVSVKELIKAGE